MNDTDLRTIAKKRWLSRKDQAALEAWANVADLQQRTIESLDNRLDKLRETITGLENDLEVARANEHGILSLMTAWKEVSHKLAARIKELETEASKLREELKDCQRWEGAFTTRILDQESKIRKLEDEKIPRETRSGIVFMKESFQIAPPPAPGLEGGAGIKRGELDARVADLEKRLDAVIERLDKSLAELIEHLDEKERRETPPEDLANAAWANLPSRKVADRLARVETDVADLTAHLANVSGRLVHQDAQLAALTDRSDRGVAGLAESVGRLGARILALENKEQDAGGSGTDAGPEWDTRLGFDCALKFSMCLDCDYHNRCSRYARHREEIEAKQ